MYKDRLEDLNTEKQASQQILSQNRKDLQTQVARIKQTLEKVLDKNTSLAERIRALFREQSITILSALTALSMAISTILLAITIVRVFGEKGGEATGSPSRDEGVLSKMVRQSSRYTQKTCGKGC